MKTRMRRFWISVSLAAGSLALPLSGALRAHDLPTRWTSGANSSPSWNYLLDDCLDSPMLPGTQSLTDVEPTARRGTEDWASSCPAEWAADLGRTGHSADLEFEGLFRNPISRFSKEMTCWVNEWQMLQHSSNLAQQPKQLWASLPDNGNPPTPDYSQDYNLDYSYKYVGNYEPVPLADTCAFDAEYQARQTAAELLAREVARANQIAKYEARVSQAIVDAERVAAVVQMDMIPVSDNIGSSVERQGMLGPMLCGGESREIISEQCFPRQFSVGKPRLPFGPDILDEYVAYDLDSRDQHWLGGLGKSWKLRSALGASPALASPSVAAEVTADEDPWMVASDENVAAPEAFIAPDQVAVEAIADSIAPDSETADARGDLAYDSVANDAQIKEYLDSILYQARHQALSMFEAARVVSEPKLPQSDVVLPELLPNLELSMAAASDWIEDQQCRIAGELCGFDSAYRIGNWLGDQSLVATHMVFQNTIDVAHYLDIPAEVQPSLDVYVIYVDAEGNSLAVPSSLARAWNRPEAEAVLADSESNSEPVADYTSDAGVLAQIDDSTEDSTDWVLVDQVGSQVLSTLANQLDSLGMQLLHASDLLSRWADTQIASRESEVR